MMTWIVIAGALSIQTVGGFAFNKWLYKHYKRKYGHLFEKMAGTYEKDGTRPVSMATVNILSAIPGIQIGYSVFLNMSAASGVQPIQRQIAKNRGFENLVYVCSNCRLAHRHYQQFGQNSCPHCGHDVLIRQAEMDDRELVLSPKISARELLALYIDREKLHHEIQLEKAAAKKHQYELETIDINNQQVVLYDLLMEKQRRELENEHQQLVEHNREGG